MVIQFLGLFRFLSTIMTRTLTTNDFQRTATTFTSLTMLLARTNGTDAWTLAMTASFVMRCSTSAFPTESMI